MEITKDKITEICKRLRDASIYTSKKYRSSSILERYFFQTSSLKNVHFVIN